MKYIITIIQKRIIDAVDDEDADFRALIWAIDEKAVGHGIEIIEGLHDI